MIAAWTDAPLERLGHYIVSRRVALGYRNRTDLANSLQFTVRTLADIEHGVRKASPGTYAMLENKLGLGAGQHRHHPGRRGTQRNRDRTAPPHPRTPLSHAPPPTPSPAPPPKSYCSSCDGASSAPASDAAKPGTTGTTASTRTATGPNRASRHCCFKPGYGCAAGLSAARTLLSTVWPC